MAENMPSVSDHNSSQQNADESSDQINSDAAIKIVKRNYLKISDEIRQLVINTLESGKSFEETSDLLNLNYDTVRSIYRV